MDGFRGIAILLVVLYHAYTRWPRLIPYGDKYANFILAHYGWLGVELFFMISGFVIYMTLEKCTTFSEFIFRRWLRLFPGMLVASIGIYATARFFNERPSGIPRLIDIFPGLLFIDPAWISKSLNFQIGMLEGVFWSLFVEVKFYVIFGAIYFSFRKRYLKESLAIFYLSCIVISMISNITHANILLSISHILNFNLSGRFYGWFLIGAFYYELYEKFSPKKMAYLIVISCITSVYADSVGDLKIILLSAILILIFISSLYIRRIQVLLSSNVILYFGFISYPFYLIHENLMISMIRKIGTKWRPLPDFLIPVIPVAIISIIAYLLAAYAEPFARRRIKWLIDTIVGKVQELR